jgi:hypothetical protein
VREDEPDPSRRTPPAGDAVRARQEREVAIAHSLDAAEHALVEEAYAVGEAFARVGIAFDPITFVALRVLEAAANDTGDPLDCLEVLEELGVVRRSAERAAELLADVR